MLIIFNKPYGVITQFSEHEVYPSLKEFISHKNVYPAGRLDADSEGLVILTDNGALQNKLSDPTSNIEKVYVVQVENIPSSEDLAKLEKGVMISKYITKPAKVILIPLYYGREKNQFGNARSIPTCWLEIKISEGKNRQIRKMTAAINCPTLRLVRIAIGQYSLGNLLPGEFITIGE